ncbi:MAG TPA: hypothetical protein VKU85_00125, partial [bacterium]|nr:hypothetical protein [bacterium]
MARIPARGPGLALMAALLAAIACPAAPVADDSLSVATLVRSRWGTTPRGATRVVFELDHPANHEKQGLPDDGGVEVRLLGVR